LNFEEIILMAERVFPQLSSQTPIVQEFNQGHSPCARMFPSVTAAFQQSGEKQCGKGDCYLSNTAWFGRFSPLHLRRCEILKDCEWTQIAEVVAALAARDARENNKDQRSKDKRSQR
jgi:hypothetical protein